MYPYRYRYTISKSFIWVRLLASEATERWEQPSHTIDSSLFPCSSLLHYVFHFVSMTIIVILFYLLCHAVLNVLTNVYESRNMAKSNITTPKIATIYARMKFNARFHFNLIIMCIQYLLIFIVLVAVMSRARSLLFPCRSMVGKGIVWKQRPFRQPLARYIAYTM